MSDAPSWFLPVVMALFPGSLLLTWILTQLPADSSLGGAVLKYPFALPVAAGVATGALLLYGADAYDDPAEGQPTLGLADPEGVAACLDLRDKLTSTQPDKARYERLKGRLHDECPSQFILMFGEAEYDAYR